jgi:uncharacterized protein YlxW (UPF0749 family)
MSGLVARARGVATWQVTLGAALLVLGFLIAAQLRSEGPRIRYTSQERTPLVETALDLQAQQEALKTQLLSLRAEIQALEQQGQGGAAVTGKLNDQLQAARLAAGLVALQGPGLVIQLTDSSAAAPPDGNARDYLVGGDDVLAVVRALWLAGAEGIAVNGERVVVATAIIDIGGSVLVNSAYVAAPYQVAAIGPPSMFDNLVRVPEFVDFVKSRAQTFGIGVSYATPAAVDLPAYAGSVTLRYGRPAPTPEPSAVAP